MRRDRLHHVARRFADHPLRRRGLLALARDGLLNRVDAPAEAVHLVAQFRDRAIRPALEEVDDQRGQRQHDCAVQDRDDLDEAGEIIGEERRCFDRALQQEEGEEERHGASPGR
jgi:hypothetical protein